MTLSQLWLRVPALLKTIFGGFAVGLLGSISWAGLVTANIRYRPDIPWAVPIMAILLVVWWWYFVRGRGWPASTGEVRRLRARANPVPDHLWGPALITGVLGLISVVLLQGVLGRLILVPQQQDIDPSEFPLVTVLAWVIMGALVAGLVEETAFRGYVQGSIEHRYGPVLAILMTGSLFGLAHFSHPEVDITLMPYYMAVSAVYGGLAHATDSTFPSMVLHSAGNAFSAFSLFAQNRSEWQIGNRQPTLVWRSGIDATFVVNVILFLIVTAGACLAYRALISVGRAARIHTG